MRKRQLFTLPIFSRLTEEQQGLLIPLITLCHIPGTSFLFKQGEPAKNLYIIESGTIEILFKPFDGPDLSVSRISRGGVFGWSSTLGRDSYTSTARTLGVSEIYRFNCLELQTMCKQDPDTGVIILDRLASAIVERPEGTHYEIMSILNQGMELGFALSNQGRKND